MLQRLKKLFFGSQGLENLETPADKYFAFVVMYKEIHIGTLELGNGAWKFSYSDFYKQTYRKKQAGQWTEDLVQPLFDFPDVDRVYVSPVLWPFFAGRIPGLKQPAVEEILTREHIDRNDPVALLTRFGRKNIASPFELMPA